MKMIELKPCPFCGGEAELFSDEFNQWYVGCVNPTCGCEAGLPFAKTEKAAAASWNRRTDCWVSVEEPPKYTAEYNVVCNIGSMFGGYTDVRTYRYEKITGCCPRWVIPDRYDEVVTVTHWMPLPEPPKEDE